MRGIVTGDWHFGLSVESMDRTPEVLRAVNFIVSYAIRKKVDFFSIGGDTTDNNTPHPDHLRMIIGVLNRLEEAEIPTFLMRGNHEAVADTERLWGLTPLEEIGYQNIHFIKTPTILRIKSRPFLFLPHVTLSQLDDEDYGKAQNFVDRSATELLKTVSNEKVTAITHFNFSATTAGTEASRLRQSDIQIPAHLMRSPKVTKIFNSHIHTPSEVQKVIMPGSVVCTAFGDINKKRFLDIEWDVSASKWDIKSVKTPMAPLVELSFNFVDTTQKQRDSMVRGELSGIDDKTIVRLRFECPEEILPEVDFDHYKYLYSQKALFVKNVDRVILKKKTVRDKGQISELDPIKAVEHYLKSRNPEGLERKLSLAKKVMAGGAETAPMDVSHFDDLSLASDAVTQFNEEYLSKKDDLDF